MTKRLWTVTPSRLGQPFGLPTLPTATTATTGVGLFSIVKWARFRLSKFR
jgi:hypothetical protein